MNATIYPTTSHPRIVIGLHYVGKDTWPTSAVAQTTGDDDTRDWFGLVCETWPAEPGWYWQREGKNYATVKRLM